MENWLSKQQNENVCCSPYRCDKWLLKNPAKDGNPLKENCKSWPESTAIECKSMSCTHTTKLFMRIVDFLVNMLVLKIIAGITSYILLGFD
jgi:hypothetical protein